jgi:hypothetical protein
VLSFSLLLNEPAAFEGGGTHFAHLRRTVRPCSRGTAVLHDSKALHAGVGAAAAAAAHDSCFLVFLLYSQRTPLLTSLLGVVHQVEIVSGTRVVLVGFVEHTGYAYAAAAAAAAAAGGGASELPQRLSDVLTSLNIWGRGGGGSSSSSSGGVRGPPRAIDRLREQVRGTCGSSGT